MDGLIEVKKMTADIRFDARTHNIVSSQWLCALAASVVVLAPATVQAGVTISAAATKNMVCTSGVCSPDHKSAVLNITDLQDLLATSNVKVTTGTGVLAAQTLDIVVNGALTWANGSTLTLDAYRSVTINKPISVTGTGGVSLVTDDGGTGGALSFGAKGNIDFSSLTSSLTINGAAFTLVGDIATLASDIAANPSGDYALAGDYNATGDGTYTSSPISTVFNGIFEGLGNTISHLSIHDSLPQYVGLFEDVVGVVANLRLSAVHYFDPGPLYEGGLAARNDGLLFNDSVSGAVSQRGTGGGDNVGGLVGVNEGAIQNSWSTSTVKGGAGLVGTNIRSITDCYATGSSGSGGLVGFNQGGSITNSYATGAVATGEAGGIGGVDGGLVGYNSGTITSSYSTGLLSSQGQYIGGLIGYDASNAGPITDSYWDTTTSGITNLSQGAGNISDEPGIRGETTAQLQAALPAGFSSSVWGESATINGGLPYLLALPPK